MTSSGLIDRGQAADLTELMRVWEDFESLNPQVLSIAQNAAGQVFGAPT